MGPGKVTGIGAARHAGAIIGTRRSRYAIGCLLASTLEL